MMRVLVAFLIFIFLNGAWAQGPPGPAGTGAVHLPGPPQPTYLSCVSADVSQNATLLAVDTDHMMTPTICNSLAVAFELFLVSSDQCYGITSDAFQLTLLSQLGGVISPIVSACTSSPCLLGAICVGVGDGTNYLAVYNASLQAVYDRPTGFYTTGLYGVGSVAQGAVNLSSFVQNATARFAHINATIGRGIDFFQVGYVLPPDESSVFWAPNAICKTGAIREFHISPTDQTTDFKIHFWYPNPGYTTIDGINITKNDDYAKTEYWGEVRDAFSVRPRTANASAVSRFELVGLKIRSNGMYVQQLGFVWQNRRDLACNETCSQHQLTQILSSHQEDSSYVLFILIACALGIDIIVMTLSKFWWRDTTAEYITLVTASLGLVEFVGQCLMAESLSINSGFATEYYLSVAALVSSSSINVIGNTLILRKANFETWKGSSSMHRFVYAFLLGFCFVKGNVLALLASRLAYLQTTMFSLPWSRELQLRFRILSLFELFFGSLPQMVMIIMLHNKLEEWTYLNMLFIGIGVCGIALVAWRAVFELGCPEYGLDRDRNMSRWNVDKTAASSPSSSSKQQL